MEAVAKLNILSATPSSRKKQDGDGLSLKRNKYERDRLCVVDARRILKDISTVPSFDEAITAYCEREYVLFLLLKRGIQCTELKEKVH